MIRKICLFLFLAAHLSATPQPAYPNPFIENTVNVITGDCVIFEQDLQVRGAQPIYLNREYNNGTKRQEDGGWDFIPHLTLFYRDYFPDPQTSKRDITFKEPNGQEIVFDVPKKLEKDITPLSLDLNQTLAKGISSNTTLQHLKALRASIRHDRKYIYLQSYNGCKKCYQTGPKVREEQTHEYHLIWEELPNGNYYEYFYDKEWRLIGIASKNPSRTKTYATVTITYGQSPDKDLYFTIETSDNTTCSYYYDYNKLANFHKYLLTEIHRPEKPDELLIYTNKSRKKHCGSIAERRFGNTQIYQFSYYRGDTPGIEDPKDPRIKRVREISTRDGPAGKKTPLYSLDYFLNADGSGTTKVTDAYENVTNYHYNNYKQIIRVESPGGITKNYLWGKDESINQLQGHILFENETPLLAQTYTYDEWGNILEETTWGNITGNSKTPLKIAPGGFPLDHETDKSTKTYRYSEDGRNLLLAETDENGVETLYTYLPNTFLVQSVEVIGKEKTTFSYNEDNILIKKISHNGKQTTEIFLDEKSRPKTITEPVTTTDFTYHQNGKIATKTLFDPQGEKKYTLSYEYDEKGNVTRETNPLGQATTASYNSLCKPTSLTQYDGLLSVSLDYDKLGRLIGKTKSGLDDTKQTENYTHDPYDNLLSSTDHLGRTTKYTYDPAGNPLSVTQGSITTQKSYNALSQVTSETDGEGNTTTYTRNIYGDPLTITYPDGAIDHFFYNIDGTLSKTISPSGTVTDYSYDKFKRLLSKSIYSPSEELISKESHKYDNEHLISSTDPLGLVTEFTYDDLGRKIQETTGPLTTTYSYDLLGRPFQTQTGEQITQVSYDLLDREIEKLSLDPDGNLYGKTEIEYDPLGNKKAIHTSVEERKATELFLYDSFNRLVEQIDPEGSKTTISYFENPHKKTTTFPNGRQTTETFDRNNRLTLSETFSPDGILLHATSYEYNGNSQCTKQTDTISDENKSWEQTTLREYNCRSQLSSLIEAPGTREQKKTTFLYDPSGHLIHTDNPNKTSIDYTYNPLGKIHTLQTKDVSYLYHYDAAGRITSVDDLIHKTSTKRTYDPLGNLLSETLDSNFTFQNEYDNLGRRTKLTLPDNTTIGYHYDSHHLRQITRGNALIHEFFSYDLSGNLLQETGATYQYNLRSQKQNITSSSYSQTVLERDPMGNPLRETINNKENHYSYNCLSQLTSDPYHNYSYDTLHNRTAKDQKTYTLNNANQLLATSTTHYQYDESGYPLSKKTKDATIYYTYDGLGRLTLAENPKTWRIAFTYDSFHRRLSKTIHTYIDNAWKRTLKEYYYFDGDNEIGSTSGDLRILGRTHQAEIGAAVQIELGNTSYTPIYDLRGTLCGLADTETTEYTPFGETLTPSSHNNPWGFLSKRHEPELNLIFFGRRYYDPDAGRFLTPDPAGFTDGPNLYTYCNNNPLTNIDLYGLYIHVEFHMDVQDAWRLGLQTSSYVGQGIYNFSYHAIPIKPFRQLGMAFGNLLKREKSPYYSPPSSEDAIPGHTPQNGSALMINGILTDKEQARSNAQALRSNLKGMEVQFYHSTTRGFLLDILSAGCALMGIQTEDSLNIARILRTKANFYRANDINGHIFALAHSRGGAFLGNALKLLTSQEKAMTHVYTFGSASLFNTPGLASLTHYVSNRDPVSALGSPLAYTQARMGKRDNVQFIPSKGGLFDHSLLGETYADQLGIVSKNILELSEGRK